MSELWETVPVSRKVREALWYAAEHDTQYFGYFSPLEKAAQQFREDVLAAEPVAVIKRKAREKP